LSHRDNQNQHSRLITAPYYTKAARRSWRRLGETNKTYTRTLGRHHHILGNGFSVTLLGIVEASGFRHELANGPLLHSKCLQSPWIALEYKVLFVSLIVLVFIDQLSPSQYSQHQSTLFSNISVAIPVDIYLSIIMSQYYSSTYYSGSKPIIRDARYESSHSGRDSSSDSRGSYYSSSSADYAYSNRSCYGSTEESKRKHRVPDNGELTRNFRRPDYHHQADSVSSSTANGYVTTTHRHNVVTTNQQQKRYDAEEPRASEATHKEYSSSSRSGGKSKSSSSSHHSSHNHKHRN
jgi:hypothetical protein